MLLSQVTRISLLLEKLNMECHVITFKNQEPYAKLLPKYFKKVSKNISPGYVPMCKIIILDLV